MGFLVFFLAYDGNYFLPRIRLVNQDQKEIAASGPR
jgi:hypothetical protein